MKPIQQTVQNHLKRLELKVTRAQELLNKLRSYRLTSGLLFLGYSVFISLKSNHASLVYLGYIFCFFIFLFFVFRSKKSLQHLNQLQALQEFYRRQHHRLLGQPLKCEHLFSNAPPGLPADLGLLESPSLLDLMDEALTPKGQQLLVTSFHSNPLNSETILSRQKQIKNSRHLHWFYTRLRLDAKRDRDQDQASARIQNLLLDPIWDRKLGLIAVGILGLWTVFLLWIFAPPAKALPVVRYVALVFPVASLALSAWLAPLFGKVVSLSHLLSTVSPLFLKIENKATTSYALKNICPQITLARPSKATRNFERALNFLGTQTNPILHIILNLFTPWTTLSSALTQKYLIKTRSILPPALLELAELEVLGSLVIFDRYQSQCYPVLSDSSTLIAKKLFHPLIPREKVVTNDFSFSTNKSLALLTGSNMSGKSTFLRTLGINQTLANMGAPVFASSLVTSPFRIETCINVSDSLRDGFSYFYSEVHRLKQILDSASSGRPTLVLVDELFRGTNNRERHLGSQALIKKWSALKNVCSFVSSHDLELAHLEKTCPGVENFHFKESIDQTQKMVFDYKIQKGASPTTNALKIMELEGLLTTADLRG